jgi:hypothetical protein
LPAICLRGGRTKEGLTQKQLSEITGIPRCHISAMENGKRPTTAFGLPMLTARARQRRQMHGLIFPNSQMRLWKRLSQRQSERLPHVLTLWRRGTRSRQGQRVAGGATPFYERDRQDTAV